MNIATSIKQFVSLRLLSIISLVVSATLSIQAFAVETERVNTSRGTPAVQQSDFPSISYDASRVVFQSRQPNLVAGDTNGLFDIFLFERRSKDISRISVSSAGAQATGSSFKPEISGNGRFVVYHSNATNLVGNAQANATSNVFRFDIDTATTELVSVNLAGDGADGVSNAQDLTTDGSLVVFDSDAPGLVAQDTNGLHDIFVRDMDNATTERIVAFDGAQPNGASFAPTVTETGRYVAFESLATNLVDADVGSALNVYLYDRVLDVIELVSAAPNGSAADGASTNPVVSRLGRYVAFTSQATNLVAADGNGVSDVFRFDRFTKDIERVTTNFEGEDSQAGGGSPSMADRGEIVSFTSASSDILETPSQFTPLVYQKDMRTGRVRVVSTSSEGALADAASVNTATDRSGRYVAYTSVASNLDGDDLNPLEDIYLTDQGNACNVASASNLKTVASGQWVQLSLPCQPPTGTTVSDLFDDDIPGAYGETWIVFTYNPAAQPAARYVNPGADGTLAAGVGFWFQQLSDTTVTLDLPEGSRGLPSNFDEGAACISVLGCRSVELTSDVPGNVTWQMVGNPFQQSRILVVANLRFTSSTGECSVPGGCTLGVATGANLVFDSLFSFDGEQYVDLASDQTINAWNGFWVAELPGADGNTVRLVYAEGPLSAQ